MKYTEYDERKFRYSVNEAMQTVSRILHTDRHPSLAGDVDHKYQNKYELANSLTNVAVISLVTVLEKMGLDAETLRKVANEAKSSKRSVTLRFEASDKCEYLMQQKVEVPSTHSLETTETTEATGGIFGSLQSQKTTVQRVVSHVDEYHWKVTASWKVVLYIGTYGDSDSSAVTLQERTSTAHIVTRSRPDQPPIASSTSHDPIEVPLTWLFDQIDSSDGVPLSAKFSIDVEDDQATRTPLRNRQVDDASAFFLSFSNWCSDCDQFFSTRVQRRILDAHSPALPSAPTNDKKLKDVTTKSLFCPIQPFFEDTEEAENGNAASEDVDVESNAMLALPAQQSEDATTASLLLRPTDMCKLLNEHVRALDVKITTISKNFPSKQLVKLVSVAEAEFVMLCRHAQDLREHYVNSIGYIEEMLRSQLKAAIGKEVSADDLDRFVRHHNTKLLSVPPRAFCHAVRRPQHYPDGILTIEDCPNGNSSTGDDGEVLPIETLVRKVDVEEPLRVPLSAAVTLQLTGSRYLHGWLQHRFEYAHKSYQLVCRARQFSSFVLVVGKMSGPNSLSPKDAIILQNKDALMIPLLLEELPSSKEFKDAIQSLSPEQQSFAKSFRSMQLESSVLGVCIVQIKPQLESLLGLPSNALTKEMKLTQDLTELFVEYQVPSDLLSYDDNLSAGAEDEGGDGELVGRVSAREKVAAVKGHVKAVMDVISGERDKQLEEQKMKAEMAKQEYQMSHPEPTPMFRAASAPRTKFSAAPAPQALMMMSSAAPPTSRSLDVDLDYDPMGGAERLVEYDDDNSCDTTDQQQQENQEADHVQSGSTSNKNDFTLIPKMLDDTMAQHDQDNALRSTIIKTGESWTRTRQPNLLAKHKTSTLSSDDIRAEKNKAFDLLDALSRSGSLPIACSELHVLVSMTHGFDNDVMGTVIQDNVNPIEKLEKSTLLMASAIYGVPVGQVVAGGSNAQRLRATFPSIFEGGSDGTAIADS